MKQSLHRLVAFVAVTMCLALSIKPIHAQDFENQAEARQFITELQAMYSRKSDISAPMKNLVTLVGREYRAYAQAVNGSETVEETEAKYQVPLEDFKKARAEFDVAIAAAEKLAAKAQSPEIQALANQYVESLRNSQSRINHIAVAIMYHDSKAFIGEIEGLKSAAKAVGNSWRAQSPAIISKFQAAKAMFQRDTLPPKDDCPYEEGTRTHALHCILGQPMSEGSGN